MPRLSAKERRQLPDSAFAYIDSRGRRRLPIHDAAHVRNALARFSQVAFEDEGARDRARNRLLRAAQKHRIMPIGFISAQLQPQRKLPRGQVTFLLTDLEGSTELLARLEGRYAPLIAAVRRRVRAAVRQAGGHEVDARGDDLFAVFERGPSAIEAALAIQRAMRGGQIVMSSAVRSAVMDSLPDDASVMSLGAWRFRGLPERVELFQLDAPDLPTDFPPLRSATPAT